MDDFFIWLNGELNKRSWSNNELARQAGLSTSAVHATLSQKNRLTWDFCASIAEALKLPPETVFRRAGLLRPSVNESEVQRVTEIAKQLDPVSLTLLADLGTFLYQRSQNGKS